jgi:DNA-binding PadR family transcriptional regulator
MAKANKQATHLGELEQLVLLALVRLGDEAYGITVRDEIVRRAGRSLTVGSVYKTLLRLEGKGFVSAWQGEPTAERGGRRKTHYRVLPAGHRALEYSLAALRRMASGLSPAMDLK